MTKRLTDEELEELARRVRPGYVELFPHELASLLAEVREMRAAVAAEARINVAQLDELYELRAFKAQIKAVK